MPGACNSVDLFSAAIPVTPKAAQPCCKAPLKALLHEGLLCDPPVPLPWGRAEPALQEEFTFYPPISRIQRSSKALCKRTRKVVW